MKKKTNSHKGPHIISFHLYETPRTGKAIETQVQWWLFGAGGLGGNGAKCQWVQGALFLAMPRRCGTLVPRECEWRVSESCSVVSDSLRPHGLQNPWNSPGQNTGVASLFLFQEIFPTQGLNPRLPHCRQILYQLSHKGSPLVYLEHHLGPRSQRVKPGLLHLSNSPGNVYAYQHFGTMTLS